MTSCARSSVERYSNGHCFIVGLPCRSWFCPECARKRSQELYALALAGHGQRFITLTVSDRIGKSANERAVWLVEAFRKYRRWWLRQHPGKAFRFFAVFERTKAGEPHLHILQAGSFIKFDELSPFMEREIAAPVVHLRKINDKRAAAGYVSKYVAKEPAKFEGCKRYFYSLDWKSKAQRAWERAKRETSNWRYCDVAPWLRAEFYERMGFAVWKVNENEWSTMKPTWGARSPPQSTFDYGRAA